MPTTDLRYTAYAQRFNPGQTRTLHCVYSESIAGRTFAAVLDDIDLPVTIVDDTTVDIVFDGALTEDIDTREAHYWFLYDITAGDDPLQIEFGGPAHASTRGVEIPDDSVVVTSRDVTVNVTVLGEPGPPGSAGSGATAEEIQDVIGAFLVESDTILPAYDDVAGTETLEVKDGIFQPADSDLTAIAALSTTVYGRAFLALADAAAGRTALGLGTAAVAASGDFEPAGAVATAIANLINSAPGALDTLDELAAALGDDANFASTMTTALAGKQPLDADLTAIAALTTTSYGRSVLEAANAAALRTLAGLVIGTNVQAWDADLDTLAAGGAPATALLASLLSGTYVALAGDGDLKRNTVGAIEYSLRWQTTGQPNSGLKGLVLARGGTNFPIGLTLESVAGTPVWDTIALDYATTDLVLAFSHLGAADQIRVGDGGTNGPYIKIGPSVGSPSTTKRLHIIGSATETTVTRLVYAEIASGSSVLDYFRGQFNGVENCNINRSGQAAFGMVYSSAISGGGLEAATAASIVGASTNPILFLKRTTDLSKSYLLDVTNAGVLRIRDNSRGQNVIFADTNGNLALGGVNAALATNATNGFVNIVNMAGTPTGTPTSTGTGGTPIVIDTTGSKLWAYIGGAWKSVALA